MCAKQVKKLKKAAKSKSKKTVSKKETAKKAPSKKAATKKTAAKKTASKKSTTKKAEKKAATKKKSTAPKKASPSKANVKTDTKMKGKSKKGEETKASAADKPTPPKKKSRSRRKKKAPQIERVILKKIVPVAKKVMKSGPNVATSKNNSASKKPIAIIKPKKEIPNSRKTRYNQKELQFFKKIIDEKLIEAKKQLEFYQTQIKSIGSDPDSKLKGLDDGTSTSETEKMYGLAARQRKHIQHLENALLRIQNNIYGVCRVTGTLIAKERLIAVPHATLSIAAKLLKS